MHNQTTSALDEFTAGFIGLYDKQLGQEPSSSALQGIASPCIIRSTDDQVFWLPQPFTPSASLNNVEQALDIIIRPELHQFYTHQFAGDMSAQFADHFLSLIQVWSEDDFLRLQENLIGHLVTQRRLKLTPTLFIGTTSCELAIISVCNLTGAVLLEQFGTTKREQLSPSLPEFISQLAPLTHSPLSTVSPM